MDHCKADLIVAVELKVRMEWLGSAHAASIRADNNQIVFIFDVLEHIRQTCEGTFIIIKLTLAGHISLSLQTVQIHRDNLVDAHKLEDLRDISWTDGCCLVLEATILPCVTIVGANDSHRFGTGAFACRDHKYKLHQAVVDGLASWLHDVAMLIWDVFRVEANWYFAICKLFYCAVGQGGAQVFRDWI